MKEHKSYSGCNCTKQYWMEIEMDFMSNQIWWCDAILFFWHSGMVTSDINDQTVNCIVP